MVHRSHLEVSLNYFNQYFNDEIKTDFLFSKIQDYNHTIMHLADPGIKIFIGATVTGRKVTTIIREFDISWAYHHGTPNMLSADDKFSRPEIVEVLNYGGVNMSLWLSRRHNKIGIIQNNNETIMRIIESTAGCGHTPHCCYNRTKTHILDKRIIGVPQYSAQSNLLAAMPHPC